MKYPDKKVEAWAHFLRSYKVLLERIEEELVSEKLPPLEWYDVLLELRLAPDRQLRLSELADSVLLSRSNLTRLCDRMEKKGLIKRRQCSDDGRGLYAVLTPQGAELQKRMWPVYASAIAKHFGNKLSVADAQRLTEMMRALRQESG